MLTTTLFRVSQEVQRLPVHRLKFHEKNFEIYNKDTDESLQPLLDDIKTNGIRQALMVLPDGTILSGSRRKICASKLDYEEVPCIVVADANPETQISMLISFNQYRHKSPREIYNEGEMLKANIKHGTGRRSAQVASALGVGSYRQYERIKKVMSEAPEHIKDAVDKGKISVSAAYDDIMHLEAQAPEIQNRATTLLKSGNEQDIKTAVRKARRAWQAEQAPIAPTPQEPVESDEEVIAQNTAVLYFYPYEIPAVKAKTPWEPNQAMNDCLLGNVQKSKVGDHLFDHGLLFLWSYARTTPFALQLLKNWNFEFITLLTLKANNKQTFLDKGFIPEDSSVVLVAKKAQAATPKLNKLKSNSLNSHSRNSSMDTTPLQLIDFIMEFGDGPYLQIYGPNLPERCEDENWRILRP